MIPWFNSGAPRGGGAGGYNDPGAHGFQEGSIEMILRNQHVRPEGPFFGDHLISAGKTTTIAVKTFFFDGDHIIFRT